MGKTAKVGGRKVNIPQKIRYCENQHPLFRVVVVPVFGRRRREWACECTLQPMRDR